MILPWPLTTSTELAHVLRPGGHLRADSALRTLRDRAFPALPITVVPRSGRGAHGRAVWYSSLMLDVARLVRTGDLDAAASAHAAASELAMHRSARFVSEWLVEHGGPDPDPAALDADTGGALTRLATQTASSRAKLAPYLGVDSFVGRVAEVTGGVASVVDDEGHSRPVPAPAGSSIGSVGSLVAVDAEGLPGGATTLWVWPAINTEADPNKRGPGRLHLLTAAEQDRLAGPVASTR